MYTIKPLVPGAIDALTGNVLPPEGVPREVLLPPDHYAERVGEVLITPLVAAAESPAAALVTEKAVTATTPRKPG